MAKFDDDLKLFGWALVELSIEKWAFLLRALALTAILLIFSGHIVLATGQNSQQVQKIIDQSIASYAGACACPYSIASNGSRCGKRSAYSKQGGHSPFCYREDVLREYPELASTNKKYVAEHSTTQWVCETQSSSTAEPTYQFHNDKVEILTDSKIKAQIERSLGEETLNEVRSSTMTVYSLASDGTVRVKLETPNNAATPLEILFVEEISKLKWEAFDGGIIGSGLILLPLAPDLTVSGAATLSLGSNGKTHTVMNFMIDGMPFTLFSTGGCAVH